MERRKRRGWCTQSSCKSSKTNQQDFPGRAGYGTEYHYDEPLDDPSDDPTLDYQDVLNSRRSMRKRRLSDQLKTDSNMPNTKRHCIQPNYLSLCTDNELHRISKLTVVDTVKSPKVRQGLVDFVAYFKKHSIDRCSLVVKILAKICKVLLAECKDSDLKEEAEKLLRTVNFLDVTSCFTFWGEISSCIRVVPYRSL